MNDQERHQQQQLLQQQLWLLHLEQQYEYHQQLLLHNQQHQLLLQQQQQQLLLLQQQQQKQLQQPCKKPPYQAIYTNEALLPATNINQVVTALSSIERRRLKNRSYKWRKNKLKSRLKDDHQDQDQDDDDNDVPMLQERNDNDPVSSFGSDESNDIQKNTLTLKQPAALSSQHTTPTTATTKACDLKKPPLPLPPINLPSNTPLGSTTSSEHDTATTTTTSATIISPITKVDPKNIFKDPILNPLEMEVVWLAAESMYCCDYSKDPVLSCRTIQWDYVWEFAGPALRIELQKCKNFARQQQHKNVNPSTFSSSSSSSSAAVAAKANNNMDKQLLQQLIRMDDWLISKRFAIVRDHVLAWLVCGYRRPSQATVIADNLGTIISSLAPPVTLPRLGPCRRRRRGRGFKFSVLSAYVLPFCFSFSMRTFHRVAPSSSSSSLLSDTTCSITTQRRPFNT